MPSAAKAAEKRCRARWADAPGATWAWHCHHDRLCEPLTAPATGRIDFIRDHKPEDERKRRWDLFAPLDARLLPPALVEAGRAYVEAERAYAEARRTYGAKLAAREAYRAYVKTWRAYDEAWHEAQPELEALHKQLCVPNCSWNGTTIFPKGPP